MVASRVQPTLIRPPDPAIVGMTTRYMAIGSADAARRLMHLAFRDAHTALDLTFAAGGFWADPLPPGLAVTSNNLDPESVADLHLDFTATGLSTGRFGLVAYDPPHIADGGQASIMARRFGTVKGTQALRDLVQGGAREAWRLASVGILVKLADSSHGGEFHRLTRWVEEVIPVRAYCDLHTIRPPVVDGKWRVARVPRNNGATYLVFRKSGHRHISFDDLYARQESRRVERAS